VAAAPLRPRIRSSGSACATPSPDELAAVQREFGLPAPPVDGLATAARRSVLELTGELMFAVVKATTWVAAEEAVRLGEVQLVLGDRFVISADRDGAVLERVRQDLEHDPELVGAGLAAVLPCVVDHAAEGYRPVLRALNNAVEQVEEAVFSPAESRPTERI
jgi:magnesium transporter